MTRKLTNYEQEIVINFNKANGQGGQSVRLCQGGDRCLR